MKHMSGGAILVFILCVVGAIIVKNRFFEFDSSIDIAVSAGAGALGGLIGGAIETILFPTKGDEND